MTARPLSRVIMDLLVAAAAKEQRGKYLHAVGRDLHGFRVPQSWIIDVGYLHDGLLPAWISREILDGKLSLHLGAATRSGRSSGSPLSRLSVLPVTWQQPPTYDKRGRPQHPEALIEQARARLTACGLSPMLLLSGGALSGEISAVCAVLHLEAPLAVDAAATARVRQLLVHLGAFIESDFTIGTLGIPMAGSLVRVGAGELRVVVVEDQPEARVTRAQLNAVTATSSTSPASSARRRSIPQEVSHHG